jgi:hypothetical protein
VTDSTKEVVDRVTHGRWKVVSAYSHDLSPIERGFSMVWLYVRAHHREAQSNPIGVINSAFHNYSVKGPQGYKGRYSCCITILSPIIVYYSVWSLAKICKEP